MGRASTPALEHQQQVFALLTEAVELEGGARAELLEDADPELAADVRSLLEDDLGDGFLEQPPVELTKPSDGEDETLEAGRKIGPYRIFELLGAGGMGQVYLAAQEQPVRRRVALKLLRFSLSQPEIRRRFEIERQAMERLDHPYVGKILDAGSTDDGVPYLAMEYIVGEPIIDYCDRRRLSLGARVDLIVKVCRGLEHAHQCFLLHRDIKPSPRWHAHQGTVQPLLGARLHAGRRSRRDRACWTPASRSTRSEPSPRRVVEEPDPCVVIEPVRSIGCKACLPP